MWLLIAFIAVPVVEIALFIQMGGLIGTPLTLALVVLTAILGTWMVRTQGRLAIGNLQKSFTQLNDPTEPLAHGAMVLISGALLLTPGFFTDAVGFALLVPQIRSAVFHYFRKRVNVQSFSVGGDQTGENQPHQPSYSASHEGEVIDGQFHEIGPDKRPTHSPSGWTKH